LFFDYGYSVAKADDLINIRGWNGSWSGSHSGPSVGRSTQSLPAGEGPSHRKGPAVGGGSAARDYDEEKVLVVEAFGVRDNEVLARAWCSHWGQSAVVADIGKTW
jgi:hypothetical protein